MTRQTISIYEYILTKNGKIYISTDVNDLFEDMKKVILESGFFKLEKEIRDELVEKNENHEEMTLFEMTYKGTDEANRAGIKTGETYAAIFIKK